MTQFPSPAIAIVGRHNSGKTTLIEKLIAELTKRGLNVGSVKHHSHVGFDIDIPGKDSYRHRAAGAREVVIAAPGQMARIKTLEGEIECAEIVDSMPGYDIVIVEGYRKSGLPTIEIMRAANAADAKTATVFAAYAQRGLPLGTDFVQAGKNSHALEASRAVAKPNYNDITNKLPQANTVAVVTDIPEATHAAQDLYKIPAFGLEDVSALADFVQQQFARTKLTLVIQAGGESKRMGRSKATVPFLGRPLICWLIERLSSVADELIVTTNEPDNLAFLEDEFPSLDITLVRDTYNERGALPGLYTALQAASNPYVAAVACDMVFASDRLIVAEVQAMNETGAAVVVPVNKHGFEPFHALYNRDACMPAVKAAIERGEKRAQVFFGDVNVCEFPQEKVLAAEPRGGCFINANTPSELHALEAEVLRQNAQEAQGQGFGQNQGQGLSQNHTQIQGQVECRGGVPRRPQTQETYAVSTQEHGLAQSQAQQVDSHVQDCGQGQPDAPAAHPAASAAPAASTALAAPAASTAPDAPATSDTCPAAQAQKE